VCCLLACVARGQLSVANGSFESGYSSWSTPNATNGVSYTTVTPAATGTLAARVANRILLSDAPRQNVTTSLAASSNGTTYATRFWIKVDTPASVRCALQFNDSSGLQRHILAERMITTTGAWMEVRNAHTVTWTGTPTNAVFFFEVGMMVETNFGAYTLDGIRVHPDSDGDGLADVEEVTTSSATNDTDTDGLPDLWEIANGFLSTSNESADDTDSDGYNNREEYWAVTDPRAALSFPGRPANPSLSARGCAVLEYLALLPSFPSNRVLAGQHVSYPQDGEFTNFITRLYQDTGQWPGLLALQYDDVTNPLQVAAVNPYAIDYWTNGGLVQIKWQLRNPWTGKAGASDTNQSDVDLLALVDPTNGPPANLATNLAAHANFTNWLAQAADGLQELRTSGVIVLWRPFSEMNGGWFWHGHRNRDGYIAMWRWMFDYFTYERGLNNLIWVYESDSSVHDMVPVDYYYPGDDVVDVMGHNYYDDDWMLPFESEQLCREHGKVYAFPQAGSATIRDGTWTNTIMTDGIQARHPRCSYFACWNSHPVGGSTSTSMRAIVDGQAAQELMDHPWIATRDDVAWTNHLREPSVTLLDSGSGPLVDWRSGNLQESTDLENWSTPAAPAWPYPAATATGHFFRTRD